MIGWKPHLFYRREIWISFLECLVLREDALELARLVMYVGIGKT
ncbi:hypothetical protein [Pontibacter brevis]